MTKAFIGAAVAGLLLAGCNMPQQPAATTTASTATPGQNCKKMVQDTGSKIMDRSTTCDHGNGAGAMEDALRHGSQGIGGNK